MEKRKQSANGEDTANKRGCGPVDHVRAPAMSGRATLRYIYCILYGNYRQGRRSVAADDMREICSMMDGSRRQQEGDKKKQEKKKRKRYGCSYRSQEEEGNLLRDKAAAGPAVYCFSFSVQHDKASWQRAHNQKKKRNERDTVYYI